jgi:hypothetical protein
VQFAGGANIGNSFKNVRWQANNIRDLDTETQSGANSINLFSCEQCKFQSDVAPVRISGSGVNGATAISFKNSEFASGLITNNVNGLSVVSSYFEGGGPAIELNAGTKGAVIQGNYIHSFLIAGIRVGWSDGTGGGTTVGLQMTGNSIWNAHPGTCGIQIDSRPGLLGYMTIVSNFYDGGGLPFTEVCDPANKAVRIE